MEIGTVIEIKDGIAVVALPYKSLCDKCNMCHRENDTMIIEIPNELGAHKGDSVKIVMAEKESAISGQFSKDSIPVC